MVLTLYKMDASPPARAVMMLIDLLKIPNVKYQDVNLLAKEQLSEEFIKMNPQHTIPVLKDGDFTIWDSHAIVAYLVAIYAKDDSLYPKEPKKRAVVDQRLHFDTGVLFTALRGLMLPVFYLGETKFRQENLDKFEPAYEFCERFLTNTWMAGDQLTVADICCVASLSSMDGAVPIDKQKFPKLTAWMQRMSSLGFYKKANEPGDGDFKALLKKELFP